MCVVEERVERGMLLDMIRDLLEVEVDTKKVYWEGDALLRSLVMRKLFVRQANCFLPDVAALGFAMAGDKLIPVRESRCEVLMPTKMRIKVGNPHFDIPCSEKAHCNYRNKCQPIGLALREVRLIRADCMRLPWQTKRS